MELLQRGETMKNENHNKKYIFIYFIIIIFSISIGFLLGISYINVQKHKLNNTSNVNDNYRVETKNMKTQDKDDCKKINTMLFFDKNGQVLKEKDYDKATGYEQTTKIVCDKNENGVLKKVEVYNETIKQKYNEEYEKARIINKINRLTIPMVDFIFQAVKVIDE